LVPKLGDIRFDVGEGLNEFRSGIHETKPRRSFISHPASLSVDENLDILTNLVSKKKLQDLGLIYPYHVQNGDHRDYIDRGILSKHNLIMPYKDLYGSTVAFVGRTLLSEEDRSAQGLQKYKYTPFTRSLHLFGLFQSKKEIFEKNSCILVEGQIDCLTCHEFGISNVVALGGVAFTKYQFNLLRRLTDNFYLLLDSDLEGAKGSQRIIKRYSGMANFKQLSLTPGYKDIDTCLRKTGNTSWLEMK